MNSLFDKRSSLFDNRYDLIEKLGQGTYGVIYSAIDTCLNKSVVIKLARFSLASEAEVFRILHRFWSPTGIPKMLSYVKNTHEYIVMEKLGKDIHRYWKRCGYKFSLKTVFMLGTQMISRLESVHNGGILHRDVKDDNFVMDEHCRTLYIIDFGLSSSYIDERTWRHIPEEVDERVRGTFFYASLNTHKKIRSSRRDDIESLAYVLIRFLKGRLPWEQGLVNSNDYDETFDIFGRRKMHTRIEILCAGVPEEITEFLMYARGLGFTERPDYAYLQDLLRRAFVGENLSNDGVYDWMVNESSPVGV